MAGKRQRATHVLQRGRMIGVCLLFTVLIFPFQASYARIPSVVDKVTTEREGEKSFIHISVPGTPACKVITIDDKELMIALKDVQIGGDVFAAETVLGDPFVHKIRTDQRPSQVASVIIELLKPLEEIQYQIKKDKGFVRLEIQKRFHAEENNENRVITAGETTKQNDLVWIEEWGTKKEKKDDSIKEETIEDVSPGPLTEEEQILEEAAYCMEQRSWENAVTILEDFIEKHPLSSHMEQALFMLAKSVHRSHENEIPQYLLEIMERYKIALSKFPESEFAAEALVAMGNTHLSSGQYYEALTYYNQVLNEFKKHPVTAEASLQRARAFALSKKPLMAIRELEKFHITYPNSTFISDAKMALAKTLFDIKSFKRSLRILEEIKEDYPRTAQENPDVLLYMGYNHYELGQLPEARERLSEALNLFPDFKSSDLVLTRIADTFREDGMEEKASKLYDLVSRTYPNSEGSLISLLRVAESLEGDGMGDPEEEKEGLKRDRRAQDIYREIIDRAPESPLARISMLKLATFQKKNKKYNDAIETLQALLKKEPKSKLREQVEISMQDTLLRLAITQKKQKEFEGGVESLKTLISQYPETQLMDEILPVLRDLFASVLETKKRYGETEKLIAYYEKYKDVFPFKEMPKILLEAAQSYKDMNLYGHAYDTFANASASLQHKGLPPTALLDFAQCAFEEKKTEKAESTLHTFLKKYPKHKDIAVAQYWLGRVHLRNQEYKKASYVLQQSLDGQVANHMKPKVLEAMAEAAWQQGKMAQAATTLQKAVVFMEEADDDGENLFGAYRRLAEIHAELGHKARAAANYEKALTVMPKDAGPYGVQYRLAQCYQELEERGKAEKLLRGIVAAGDPFWSKLAKTQINEISIGLSAERLGIEARES